MDLYTLLKTLHVLSAIAWVGGGLLGSTLAIRAARRGDDMLLAAMAQLAWCADHVFVPAAVATLAFGLGMTWLGGLWLETWILIGLGGIAATSGPRRGRAGAAHRPRPEARSRRPRRGSGTARAAGAACRAVRCDIAHPRRHRHGAESPHGRLARHRRHGRGRPRRCRAVHPPALAKPLPRNLPRRRISRDHHKRSAGRPRIRVPHARTGHRACARSGDRPRRSHCHCRILVARRPAGMVCRQSGFRPRLPRRLPAAARTGSARRTDDWATSAYGSLALLLLLDQFPRNAFRGAPRMYATDARALDTPRPPSRRGISEWSTRSSRCSSGCLMRMPRIAVQDRSVELAHESGGPAPAGSAPSRHHPRFGRFPHRNAILGRPMRPDEQRFLDEGAFAG